MARGGETWAAAGQGSEGGRHPELSLSGARRPRPVRAQTVRADAGLPRASRCLRAAASRPGPSGAGSRTVARELRSGPASSGRCWAPLLPRCRVGELRRVRACAVVAVWASHSSRDLARRRAAHRPKAPHCRGRGSRIPTGCSA